MQNLFTSESVSEGHPDKVSDQISDAILDAFLTQDPNSRVACETLCTTGLVVVAGEVNTEAYIEIPDIVRKTIKDIGYTKSSYKFEAESCGVLVTIHQQSPDIAIGVDKSENEIGAGDQGMMFGYATNETPEFMPAPLAYAHRLVKELAFIRKETDLMPYLGPDSKSQVTIEYDSDWKPLRVHTIVVSTMHDDGIETDQIKDDIKNLLIPRTIPEALRDSKTILHVNPTGRFVHGGPHGDTGLTGRKIIVDTYGGKGAHGGGAFSGKDASKVDRSAAYACRYLAKNLVAAGIADEALIQVSYAIGIDEPISLNLNTYGTNKIGLQDGVIAKKLQEIFDLRPKKIIENLGLKYPIYSATAAYGHMGRECEEKEIDLNYISKKESGDSKIETRTKSNQKVKFFPWEELSLVDQLRLAFKL